MLDDLIERVESASEGSRELDSDVSAACGMIINPNPRSFEFGRWPEDGIGFYRIAPISTSIDAALALVERMLRTYSLHMTVDPSGNGAEITWWPNGLSDLDTQINVAGVSQDLPLAVLLALLRALKSKSLNPGGEDDKA